MISIDWIKLAWNQAQEITKENIGIGIWLISLGPVVVLYLLGVIYSIWLIEINIDKMIVLELISEHCDISVPLAEAASDGKISAWEFDYIVDYADERCRKDLLEKLSH